MTKQELIITIVNIGYADEVMDQARRCGVRGGTIIHGRGTANKTSERFFDIEFSGEKELVMMVVDSNIKDEVKMLSNTNFKVIKSVYLPMVFPYLLTSLIQSFGLGLKVMVMAEYISQPKYSIGSELVIYKNETMMEYVYAWSIILILVVIIVEGFVYYFTKKYETK